MKLPIAIQLFSLRNEAQEDLAGTLAKVKEMGYCGLGLWVSPQIAFEEKEQRSTPEQIRAYWLEKARISEEAGIRYWKVDWGKYSDTENRRIMTECAREAAPSLRLEHATPQNPFESASGEDDPRTKSMRERVEFLNSMLALQYRPKACGRFLFPMPIRVMVVKAGVNQP